MNEKLSSARVEATLTACLFEDDKDIESPLIVEGIVNTFGFRPKSVAEQREVIREMLGELDDAFMVQKGGGWSFLNACDDRYGEQWTGLHRTMDWLFCLGRAAGFVDEVLPREMWVALPGGMPYYRVDLERA